MSLKLFVSFFKIVKLRGVATKNVLHNLLPRRRFNFGEKKLRMENAKVSLIPNSYGTVNSKIVSIDGQGLTRTYFPVMNLVLLLTYISDKREVFYDMKEHAIQPCEMAIKEITHLSKATINNLRSKVRAEFHLPFSRDGRACPSPNL